MSDEQMQTEVVPVIPAQAVENVPAQVSEKTPAMVMQAEFDLLASRVSALEKNLEGISGTLTKLLNALESVHGLKL